jgi:glycosyl transferase family 25
MCLPCAKLDNPPPSAPVFVINLDRDSARLESVRRELDGAGIPFTRIPAVLGAERLGEAGLVDLASYRTRNRADSPRGGELGCYLSHLRAMEAFLATGAPMGVILEDDVRLLPGFDEVVRALGERDDWDLAKLFCYHRGMPVRGRALAEGRRLCTHLAVTTSTAAYAIRRQAAATLVATLLPMREPIDHAMDRPWESGLRIVGVRPHAAALAGVARQTTLGYEDRSRENRTVAKNLRLLAYRAGRETRRFLHGLAEVARRRGGG